MKQKTLLAYALPGELLRCALLSAEDTISAIEFCPYDTRGRLHFSVAELLSHSQFEQRLSQVELLPAEMPESVDEQYDKAIANALAKLQSGALHKVVVARQIVKNVSANLVAVFRQLHLLPMTTLRYLLVHEGNCWVGATPEVLLCVAGNKVNAHALAGTLPMASEEWTDKERREQQLVADTILAAFFTAGVKSVAMTPVREKVAANVRHLFSEISGELENAADSTQLLSALHPTPAVCGLPRKRAARFIDDFEGFDRRFYTGFIGIRKGEMQHFFVNLRCMRITSHFAVVYAGGGLVLGSAPEREKRETELKAQLMLNILDDNQ